METDSIIAILSLVVSGIALWHTYSVNRSFAKNQLIVDQIKTVNALINYLNRKKIAFHFSNISEDGSSRGGRSMELTLFELPETAREFHTYDNELVVLNSNRCNEVFEFLKYMNDPLVPASIARELSKFMSGTHQIKNYFDFGGENVVIVDSGVRYDYKSLYLRDEDIKDKLLHGNAIAVQSWLSFKTCCESLKGEIEKWLNAKAISGLNIRSDFQFY